MFFDARQTVVVHVYHAKHLRCQVAVGVHALHGLLKEHARQVLLLKRRGIVLVHLTFDIHPGAIGQNEIPTGFFIDARSFDQCRYRLVNVLDKLRIHGDVAAFDRRRQHVAVTVIDGTALGIQRLCKQATCIGAVA